MVQELGETVNEIVKDDEKEIERILSNYKCDHYWIVMHHKPTKQRLTSGEMVIARVIRPYNSEPSNQLGTIVLEVKRGEIVKETINMHDAPIDWGAIVPKAGQSDTPYVQDRPDIGGAYIYNK
jgi:hypothetical protein